MSHFPTEEEFAKFVEDLKIESEIPTRSSAESLLVSYSRLFRKYDEAVEFAKNMMLSDGESLIGGCAKDSVGDLWWAGIQVNKFEQWRANGGYHQNASRDPEVPEEEML